MDSLDEPAADVPLVGVVDEAKFALFGCEAGDWVCWRGESGVELKLYELNKVFADVFLFLDSPNRDDNEETPCCTGGVLTLIVTAWAWVDGGAVGDDDVRVEAAAAGSGVACSDGCADDGGAVGDWAVTLPFMVASALFMSSYETAWVDRLKCLSSLAFCFRISSACSSLDATGADEL